LGRRSCLQDQWLQPCLQETAVVYSRQCCQRTVPTREQPARRCRCVHKFLTTIKFDTRRVHVSYWNIWRQATCANMHAHVPRSDNLSTCNVREGASSFLQATRCDLTQLRPSFCLPVITTSASSARRMSVLTRLGSAQSPVAPSRSTGELVEPGSAEPVRSPLKTLLSRRPCSSGESGAAAVAARSIPDLGCGAVAASSPSAELGDGGSMRRRLWEVRPFGDTVLPPVSGRLL
jgi:hypothetical protein